MGISTFTSLQNLSFFAGYLRLAMSSTHMRTMVLEYAHQHDCPTFASPSYVSKYTSTLRSIWAIIGTYFHCHGWLQNLNVNGIVNSCFVHRGCTNFNRMLTEPLKIPRFPISWNTSWLKTVSILWVIIVIIIPSKSGSIIHFFAINSPGYFVHGSIGLTIWTERLNPQLLNPMSFSTTDIGFEHCSLIYLHIDHPTVEMLMFTHLFSCPLMLDAD